MRITFSEGNGERMAHSTEQQNSPQDTSPKISLDRAMPLGNGIVCVCVRACVFSCLVMSLCDPVDYSPPGSSVHGVSQARILEWYFTEL